MKWISKLFVEKVNEFCADNVRKLNDMHRNSFNKKQEKYKKAICKEIIESAKIGARYVYTEEVGDHDWLTKEYLILLKEYFFSKGFDVAEQYDYGELSLKISW